MFRGIRMEEKKARTRMVRRQGMRTEQDVYDARSRGNTRETL